jgi:hypothetical protein
MEGNGVTGHIWKSFPASVRDWNRAITAISFDSRMILRTSGDFQSVHEQFED